MTVESQTARGRQLQTRQRLRQFSNVVFFAFVLFLLFKRVPQWREAQNFEGQPAPLIQVSDLNGQRQTFPPRDGKPAIGVFWATWCGPCTLELAQLRKAAESGGVDPQRVFAVSIGEEPAVVEKAARERHYPFRILVDPDMQGAAAYKVSGTPTLVHIQADGTIAWYSMGFSPTAVWRAEKLLKR